MTLSNLRIRMRDLHRADENRVLQEMIAGTAIDDRQRAAFVALAVELIEAIRADDAPGLMEVFLAEYGLSTEEGVALMCLAEALLRVPDAETMDDLIEDKIVPSAWGRHLGHSSSSLVNASTWALMLTGKVLDDGQEYGVAGALHGAIRRLGEPVIRTAVKAAMKEMGNQFVLGETIDDAVENGARAVLDGYTYSYDMLGEAALTSADAAAYFEAYKNAILSLSEHAASDDIRDNPGISIKLSALHPRYEENQRDRVLTELTDSVRQLCLLAKRANMGLNIDAEEADRLDLSLDVIEHVFRDPVFAGWDGFGVVVQAYGKRVSAVIDWLHAVAEDLDRRIMVRLVKGAYWDTEIKRAQVDGVPDFPVFTRKAATDVSYLCAAEKLLGMTDRIYPQFATHNAHTVAAILKMAKDHDGFEFQRLHGMGDVLHRLVKQKHGTRCRIYAPVGAHRDLLAYLVRRLLENGANSSFVNQLVDEAVAPSTIARDPFLSLDDAPSTAITKPADLFAPSRRNAKGWDVHHLEDLTGIENARAPFADHVWHATPMIAGHAVEGASVPIENPALEGQIVGTVIDADGEMIDATLSAAESWPATAAERATILEAAADAYEENIGELLACLCREAGKTLPDAIAEVREAVDFLRYYAVEARRLPSGDPHGVFGCISPWNFPLAIFTGQIAAALAAGNGVIAKPAEQTPLVGFLAVRLLHQSGVPKEVLQFLPGPGETVGAALTSNPCIGGVCFTGSTETAQVINRSMAEHLDPGAPLIAETGGLNAMIVDSTALPEQAVRDIVVSAFQSAGQRCSALRMLYVQEDVKDTILSMLFGAMDELALGDPWKLATDVGPVIDADARADIRAYVDEAVAAGRVLKRQRVPVQGLFVPPTVIKVDGIDALPREVFGPVLHVATFKAQKLDQVLDDINRRGYGLTFGLHSRIDDRVQHVVSKLSVGNMYINRNQIGAIVGSQPFGGEGLSGTGPKAGGPRYVPKFIKPERAEAVHVAASNVADTSAVQERLRRATQTHAAAHGVDLPGPTGESNRLTVVPRGVVLCLGPSAEQARAQAAQAREAGCAAIAVAPDVTEGEGVDGLLTADALSELDGFDAVVSWADDATLKGYRVAIARRRGPIVPLIVSADVASGCEKERHVCIDTTASGGNATLLAESA